MFESQQRDGLSAATVRSAPSCERNAAAVAAVVSDWLAGTGVVLEIGSGTGQHAAALLPRLPGWRWQPSDIAPDAVSIRGWAERAGCPDRVLPVLELDVAASWPQQRFDAVFTANTLHIMAAPLLPRFFDGAAEVTTSGSRLFVYGPLHRGGRPTSAGNAAFDAELRARAPAMGIRDLEYVQSLAAGAGWLQLAHYQMPANNQMLVWEHAP